MADNFRPVIDRLLDEAERLRELGEPNEEKDLFNAFAFSFLMDANAGEFASFCRVFADLIKEREGMS